jgi:hypothetical protein
MSSIIDYQLLRTYLLGGQTILGGVEMVKIRDMQIDREKLVSIIGKTRVIYCCQACADPGARTPIGASEMLVKE